LKLRSVEVRWHSLTRFQCRPNLLLRRGSTPFSVYDIWLIYLHVYTHKMRWLLSVWGHIHNWALGFAHTDASFSDYLFCVLFEKTALESLQKAPSSLEPCSSSDHVESIPEDVSIPPEVTSAVSCGHLALDSLAICCGRKGLRNLLAQSTVRGVWCKEVAGTPNTMVLNLVFQVVICVYVFVAQVRGRPALVGLVQAASEVRNLPSRRRLNMHTHACSLHSFHFIPFILFLYFIFSPCIHAIFPLQSTSTNAFSIYKSAYDQWEPFSELHPLFSACVRVYYWHASWHVHQDFIDAWNGSLSVWT